MGPLHPRIVFLMATGDRWKFASYGRFPAGQRNRNLALEWPFLRYEANRQRKSAGVMAATILFGSVVVHATSATTSWLLTLGNFDLLTCHIRHER